MIFENQSILGFGSDHELMANRQYQEHRLSRVPPRKAETNPLVGLSCSSRNDKNKPIIWSYPVSVEGEEFGVKGCELCDLS